MTEDATTPDPAYGERFEKIEVGQADMRKQLDECPVHAGLGQPIQNPSLGVNVQVPGKPLIRYKSEFEMQRPQLSGWAKAGTVGGGVSFVSLAIVVILALTGNLDTRAPAYTPQVASPPLETPLLSSPRHAGASARVLSQWLAGRTRHRLEPSEIEAARRALIADGATSD